jgi:hypothetical protein
VARATQQEHQDEGLEEGTKAEAAALDAGDAEGDTKDETHATVEEERQQRISKETPPI